MITWAIVTVMSHPKTEGGQGYPWPSSYFRSSPVTAPWLQLQLFNFPLLPSTTKLVSTLDLEVERLDIQAARSLLLFSDEKKSQSSLLLLPDSTYVHLPLHLTHGIRKHCQSRIICLHSIRMSESKGAGWYRKRSRELFSQPNICQVWHFLMPVSDEAKSLL
jgi:hypothetical protein